MKSRGQKALEKMAKQKGMTPEQLVKEIEKGLQEHKEELKELAKDWSVCDGDGIEDE